MVFICLTRKMNKPVETINEKAVTRKRTNDSGIGALLLITLGLILLFNNFGLISWSFWNVLFHFWPMIFIILGVDLIFGPNLIGKTLSSTINIILVLFVILYSLSLVNPVFDKWLGNELPNWKNFKNQLYLLPSN